MGIKTKFNFNGKGQEAAKEYIKEHVNVPFFGN
jgi:hypothetical protein